MIAALTFLLIVTSRFSDGPLVEMLPGGPFKAGEIVTEGPNDWRFLTERTSTWKAIFDRIDGFEYAENNTFQHQPGIMLGTLELNLNFKKT